MNSLIVAIHMSKPLDYLSLRDIIACVGQSYEIQPRLLFVSTIFCAEELFEHLTLALSAEDSLTVVDAIGGVATNSLAPAPDAFEKVRCTTRALGASPAN